MRLSLDAYSTGGVLSMMYDTPHVNCGTMTRVSVHSAGRLGSISGGWWDRNKLSTTYVTANTNPIGYDTTVVPAVGAFTGGSAFFTGDIYFLGIWPRVWTSQESRAFCDYWLNRV